MLNMSTHTHTHTEYAHTHTYMYISYVDSRPDMTFTVDWALKTNDLLFISVANV